MTEYIIPITEIIGTIAFSFSGAMVAIKKKMDIFGVIILGISTAVGGGILRDLVLGITPPTAFIKPLYMIISIVTSVVIFLPFVRKIFYKDKKINDAILLVMDSLGLGIFTVIGIKTAYDTGSDTNIFLLNFVGVVTGIGGGIIRDIMAGQKPYVFVKHFYATASIIGSLTCCGLWNHLGQIPSMIIGASIIIILRLCAATFKWSLPKADIVSENEEEEENEH